ncbi:pumilio homolog 2-like isoform X2 [Musa acuminata AAA Group]|uniref:pumilio homolog 2-like isoform X2 n=1 Tax=Musa acuminata AAA Group TaxID=214697 RepID=UPI0031DBEB22
MKLDSQLLKDCFSILSIHESPTSAGALFLGQAAFVILALLKILETCTDEHCAILLDHIKVDLQALEKVAYKKHMVAWAEQSCGEVSPPVNDCNMRQPKMR